MNKEWALDLVWDSRDEAAADFLETSTINSLERKNINAVSVVWVLIGILMPRRTYS